MMWTARQDEKLRKWFGAGLSAGWIAAAMKVPRCAVIGRKFRLGLCDPKRRARAFSDDDVATIIAMRKAKLPHAKIAKKLRRTEDAICIKASKLGITRPYVYRSQGGEP